MTITKIIKINPENPDIKIIKSIVKEVRNGKVVIYPTETCYGLGTNALNEKAVKRVYEIKKEPKGSNVITIVANLEMAKKYGCINKTVEKIVKKFMPGPLTLVVKRKNTYPLITNRAFVFRISSNKVANLLAKYAKVPITATSANLHGKPSIYSSKKIIREFYGKVDIILDAGKLRKIPSSTIIDMRKKSPVLIRVGPVPFTEVIKFLKLESR